VEISSGNPISRAIIETSGKMYPITETSFLKKCVDTSQEMLHEVAFSILPVEQLILLLSEFLLPLPK